LDDPGTPPDATQQKPSPGEGNDGSGATGQKAPWEDDEDGGIGDTSERLVRNKVAREIVDQSRRIGQRAGGSVLDWAEEHLAGPKISWQEELRSLISNSIAWVAGSFEYTRRRFSRKQLPGMPLMPGMAQPIPEIAIVIDTSGSMSEDMLINALSEINSIIQLFGTSVGVSVYAVDNAVGWVGRVYDVRSIRLVGMGGTDMGKGIRAALANEPRPNIIIILTDGETGWPESRPFDVQIVIGIVGNKNSILRESSLPTWASKVVWIDDDGRKGTRK
jgi:predicted metal-dependent peptidase